MKVAIIGCGNMGTAFGSALISAKLLQPANILAVDPSEEKIQAVSAKWGCKASSTIPDLISSADWVILAVKPQYMAEALTELAPKLRENATVISVAAGVRVETIQSLLSGHSRIIRCMPNTPVLVGRGVTIYYATDAVPEEESEMLARTLRASGIEFRVDSEDLIDAATSVSASGAGFVFYVAENMLEEAKALGFPAEAAEQIVRETFAGAAKLWEESGDGVSMLKDKVTSEGGTTAAGLDKFEELGVGEGIRDGLRAAFDRAVELSKGQS